MRRIRIMEHISLDGIIAPGKPGEYSDDYVNGGWSAPYRTPDGAAAVLETLGDSFDLLLGRRTYDLWAGYWPKMGNHPIGNKLNAATKFVATHRPDTLGWGPVGNLGADIFDGIRRIKKTGGADLIVSGSSTLTSVLLGEGLVEEVVLIVYPLLLGRGIRLFSDSANPRELALIRTRTTPTGVVFNTYRHVGSLKTA